MSERGKDKSVKDVEASYKAFLWREISRIREAQAKGDYVLAIEYALTLVNYLPIEVKKKLRERAKLIRRDLQAVTANTRGTNFFGQSLNRAKAVTRTSKLFLEEFTDLLSTELDLREVYIERLRRAIPTGFE